MNNKIQEKNTDLTSTTINHRVDNKDKYSHMSQKFIVDKTTNVISAFVVVLDGELKQPLWFSKDKFCLMSSRVDTKPIEFPLKKTIQGNKDDNKKPQDGKALRLEVIDSTVKIGVYTQTYGGTWELSHTYIVDKVTFDAYALVVSNDTLVADIEKKNQTPENFSMNLS